MERWSETAQIALERAARNGSSLTEIAKEVRLASGGRFAPHSTTCLRKLRALGYEHRDGNWTRNTMREVSTRVDTDRLAQIRSRVRAPLGARLPPPPVTVLALPLHLTERGAGGLVAAVRDLLCATPPGWTWELCDFEETRADAIACARHQASLRGDAFEVLEQEPGQPAVVLVRRAGSDHGAQLVLVVVRYSRRP